MMDSISRAGTQRHDGKVFKCAILPLAIGFMANSLGTILRPQSQAYLLRGTSSPSQLYSGSGFARIFTSLPTILVKIRKLRNVIAKGGVVSGPSTTSMNPASSWAFSQTATVVTDVESRSRRKATGAYRLLVRDNHDFCYHLI